MIAVVVATGKDTYFGKTVQLVEEAKTVSSFQKMVIKIGDYLIILALILVSLTFLWQFLEKRAFWRCLDLL